MAVDRVITVGRIARSQDGDCAAARPKPPTDCDELKATADDSVRHKQYLIRSSLIQSLREAAVTP